MTPSPTDTAQTSKALADLQGPGELAINRVGLVGLGHMGHAFAINPIEDGYQVVVYDRDPERATALRARGASAAAQLSNLAGCDVVLTPLPDDDALSGHARTFGVGEHSLPHGRPYFHEHD
jgi:phosphoglycerate dehydrogenase-like enzyme